MSRTLVIVLLTGTAALAVWLGLPGPSPAEIRVPAPMTASGGPPMPKGCAVGQSGCLAAACHGGPAEKALGGQFDTRTWMASGTCWLAADPHGRAFSVLAEKPAGEIMERLRSATPATEDARCLACHTNPAIAEPHPDPEQEKTRVALRPEGVSCEACHGNAGGWLREHTTWQTSGMTPLVEVGNRATVCVGCHVGSPAGQGYPVRDMNHDMIAAGHPRLNFDFAEYHRRLPKHWREKTTGHAAREWLVGRVAHAEAACKLLADRAERAMVNDPRTPWPEFAEFNCAACHHKLADSKNSGTASDGSLKWQSLWPVTVIPSAERTELEPLLRTLGKGRASAAKLIDPARKAANELAKLRESLTKLPDTEMTNRVRRLFPQTVPQMADTDEMGQMLFGLAALERGKADEVFPRAFEQYQQRDWVGVRTSLDVLLRRLHR